MNNGVPVLKTCFSVLMVGVLILTACSPQTPAVIQEPDPAPTGTAVPIPVSGDDLGSISPLLRSALLIVYSNSPVADNQILPIDLVTGEVPPGLETVEFRESSGVAFSPDNTTLVFGSRNVKSCSPTCLTVIDLPTWTVKRYPIPLKDVYIEWFHTAAFSPQGDRVAMAYSTQMGSSGILLVNLTGKPDFHNVDLSHFVSQLKFTGDGSGLMVYGNTTAKNGLSSGGQAALLSMKDFQVAWQQPLPEVKDGQYHTDPGGSPELDAWYQPAAVFSPVSDRIHIAHADEDLLTTVDFDARKVSSTAIQRPQSLLDRVMASLAGVAQAKMANGAIVQGVISPDGKKLYTVGMRMVNALQENGDREVIREVFGLSEIDVESGARTNHWETESTELRIDSHGRRLFLYEWREYRGSSYAVTEVFDLLAGKWLAAAGRRSMYPSVLPGGKTVLLSVAPGKGMSLTLSILDDETLQPVREVTRWNGQQAGWLAAP
jgi:hypothetical protein